MKAQELDRDRLNALKGAWLYHQHPEGLTWDELADAARTVTDEDIFTEFSGFDFTEAPKV